MTRGTALAAGIAGAVGVAAAFDAGVRPTRGWVRDEYHHLFGPHAHIPDAPEGQIALETIYSRARGRKVELFTAVPHGYGNGAGLPVCMVLHGVTATPSDYRAFGFGRFLTAAVRRGAPPFVLAGADGGILYWEPDVAANDNPQEMLTDEMPNWLTARGFDAGRLAGWGWSMGGYGVLRLAEVQPGWLRATAAFSPDVTYSRRVSDDGAELEKTRLGIWCGRSDVLYPDVRSFVAGLPARPQVVSYGPGAHTRAYWDSVTLPAFAFIGAALGRGRAGRRGVSG